MTFDLSCDPSKQLAGQLEAVQHDAGIGAPSKSHIHLANTIQRQPWVLCGDGYMTKRSSEGERSARMKDRPDKASESIYRMI